MKNLDIKALIFYAGGLALVVAGALELTGVTDFICQFNNSFSISWSQCKAPEVELPQ